MSRVGKQILPIPAGTSVTLDNAVITVTGPKGTLTRALRDEVVATIENNTVSCAPKNAADGFSYALWGTYVSHIKNMIIGVTDGFTKKLILEGVGFKSEAKEGNLNLALGFSHPVVVKIPTGLTVAAEKNNITISGIDKEMVGQFAASVRAMKKPEPYKGKGFRYDTEVIRRKQGKRSSK